MAKIKGYSTFQPTRKAAGSEVDAWFTSDGAMVTQDWKTALVREGRCFAFSVGNLQTPATGGGVGTIPDLDQPEVMVSVPDGTAIIPKRVVVSAICSTITDAGDLVDIIVGIDTSARLNPGTPGTYTSVTPINMSLGHSRGSNCTCGKQWTANTGSATLDVELAHALYRQYETTGGVKTGWAQTKIKYELVYEPDAPVVINGPAKLLVYWGGTDPILAYATVEYFELGEGA